MVSNRLQSTSPQNLAHWFRRRAHFAKEQPALTYEGRTWSYAAMQARIQQLSAMLHDQGVSRGDRVAFLAFNCPDFLFTLFATASLGAIFVPLNFRLTASELEFLICDCGVHTLFVDAEHAQLIEDIRPGLPCRSFIQLGDGGVNWPQLDVLLAASLHPAPIVDVQADEVATIVYTSGTTGLPKGAMLTHANLWANNLNWILAFGIGPDDILLTTAPMFHVSGIFVLLAPLLLVGGHVILHRGFEAGAVIKAISEHRVTMTFAVPTMMLLMSQHEEFDSADLSSLRLVVVGGAPAPESLLKRYATRNVPVSHCYGMSECVSASTFLETDLAMDKLNSSGRAMLLAEIKLTDAQGREITDPHIKGEICIHGENVTVGYWGRPDATASALSDDGWFRSGDVGYLDNDGFLYVCDRVKDMIISGGENIYPAEIESVLLEHPAIANVAVIGLHDERWGERVVAVAVLQTGAALTLEALQTFCGDRLARYKLPRELKLIDQLPLNGAGKVVKQVLRQTLA